MFALRASARKLNDFSMSESQFRNSSSLLKPQLVGHTDKVGRTQASKCVSTLDRELSRISNWFLFTGFLIHDNALLGGSDATLCRILSEENVWMGIWLHLLWR